MACDKTCRHIHDMILAYLDGELSEDERRDFEEHIAICDSCRTDLERYRSAVELISSAGYTPPASLRESVMGRVCVDKKRSGKLRGFIKYCSVGVAAMFVLTLVVVIFPLLKTGTDKVTQSPTASDAASALMLAEAADEFNADNPETTETASNGALADFDMNRVDGEVGVENNDENAADVIEFNLKAATPEAAAYGMSDEDSITYYVETFAPELDGTVSKLYIASADYEVSGKEVASGEDFAVYTLDAVPQTTVDITESYELEDTTGIILLIIFK